MPEVLKRYLNHAAWADPFTGDVSEYSNVHIAYGYEITRNPLFLSQAVHEMDRLMPLSEPLTDPTGIRWRLYNPHRLLEALTGVPRLTWALAEARRNGIQIPPPIPLEPQRAPIAFRKGAGKAVKMTLWGYDNTLRLLGPDGLPHPIKRLSTTPYATRRQPFDRATPGFLAYVHRVTIPAHEPEGVYTLAPVLDLGVVSIEGSTGLSCNAAQPLRLTPRDRWNIPVRNRQDTLALESAYPHRLRLVGKPGELVKPGVQGSRAIFAIPDTPHDAVTITAETPTWFRIADRPPEACWVTVQAPAVEPTALRPSPAPDLPAPSAPGKPFVEGRFGRGLLIAGGSTLQFPHTIEVEGRSIRLFDASKGVIDFWVKRLWDDRLMRARPTRFFTNGFIEVSWRNTLRAFLSAPANTHSTRRNGSARLPLREWTHVAVEWRPYKRRPDYTALHLYVNGVDYATYRSIWWPGYGDGPRPEGKRRRLLESFLSVAPPGQPFVLDELRISTVARYADLTVELGPQQTFNPARFDPSESPYVPDDRTTVLFHFEGDLESAIPVGGVKVKAALNP